MKYKFILLLSSLFSLMTTVFTQIGPWAKYDAKMKGEALIRESDGGYLKEVQSIVEGGGDVNWQMQPSGLTPLMAAASGGYTEVVKFLIKNGAELNRKDASGRTALQRAQHAGNKEVVALLSGTTNDPSILIAADTSRAIISPLKLLPPKKDSTPSINVKPGNKNWPPFGTYNVGMRVKFFAGSWKEGTVKEVGIRGNYSGKQVAPGERKYLITREGAPNWNDWIDWGSVTGITREHYWTLFFVGDWRLGESMAVNTRTDGVYKRDEYSFNSANEALSVFENKTYRWKTIDGRSINGTWIAGDDGAGIVLLNGFQGANWTLRNETNAAEGNIRGLQSARLTTNGKMSITAKRPI